MAGTLWLYTWSSQTTAPPTSNQIRFNNAAYAAVSLVWITTATSDGFDVYYSLMAIAVGDTLYVQDKNDHTLNATFTVTAAPVDRGTYVEIGVVHANASAASLNNNQAIALVIMTAPGVEPPPTSPVDLAAVKRHLNLPTTDTDPDGDQDLTDKLAAAEAIILDYLKADTLPVSPIVDAAVLLQVGELWRFRGDDVEGEAAPTTPGDLSPTVTNLLRRLRDPALA